MHMLKINEIRTSHFETYYKPHEISTSPSNKQLILSIRRIAMCSGLENYAYLKSADRQNKRFSSRNMRKTNEIYTSHFTTSYKTAEILTSPANNHLYCRCCALEARGALHQAPGALHEQSARSTNHQSTPGTSRKFRQQPGRPNNLQKTPEVQFYAQF